jgi:hypothetical protein
LAHENLAEAGALAKVLAAGGRPVAVHIDKRADDAACAAFAEVAGDAALLRLRRRRCDWGMFGLAEAALDGAAALVKSGAEFSHVTLVSGADLPLRPLAELDGFLNAHPDTDMIEAVELSERRWVIDGLTDERFRLFHPFNWRTQRRLFDANVIIQRALTIHRKLPAGLTPALGSQWWTLTRATLTAILADPQLPELKRFYRWCWIPDESLFQTLARRHGKTRINRSLTLSRFDPDGRPYVFHDDHGAMLSGSDHFLVRKVHPRATRLRQSCLERAVAPAQKLSFAGHAPDDAFARADLSRSHGREHLLSPARFPRIKGKAQRASPFPYTVIGGIGEETGALISAALTRRGDITAHGRLFAPDGVRLHGGAWLAAGSLPASVAARNFWPDQFVINVARGNVGQPVAFCMAAEDRYAIGDYIAADPGASIIWYRGGWVLDLYRARTLMDGEALVERARAAEIAERGLLAVMRKAGASLIVRSAASLLHDPSGAAAEILAVSNARAGKRDLPSPDFAPPGWEDARPFLRALKKAGCAIEAGFLTRDPAETHSEEVS